MSIQDEVAKACISRFQRDFEAEGERLKRLIDELCNGNKLMKVTVTDMQESDDGPMTITLRIDPPGDEALKPYLKALEPSCVSHHKH